MCQVDLVQGLCLAMLPRLSAFPRIPLERPQHWLSIVSDLHSVTLVIHYV